jgi:hypothetical protein
VDDDNDCLLRIEREYEFTVGVNDDDDVRDEADCN